MRSTPLIPGHEAEIPSPAVIIHWPEVEENLRRMLAMAASPDLLRPHLKTHKLPQIITRLAALGVRKAKCATIAEAEMDTWAKDGAFPYDKELLRLHLRTGNMKKISRDTGIPYRSIIY